MSNEKDLLTAALRLDKETGHGYVRDIESDIFPRPTRAPTADFDGDTFNYEQPKAPRLPLGELQRRIFNNMSLTRKNRVRKLQRLLKNAQRPNVERLRHEVRQARKK